METEEEMLPKDRYSLTQKDLDIITKILTDKDFKKYQNDYSTDAMIYVLNQFKDIRKQAKTNILKYWIKPFPVINELQTTTINMPKFNMLKALELNVEENNSLRRNMELIYLEDGKAVATNGHNMLLINNYSNPEKKGFIFPKKERINVKSISKDYLHLFDSGPYKIGNDEYYYIDSKYKYMPKDAFNDLIFVNYQGVIPNLEGAEKYVFNVKNFIEYLTAYTEIIRPFDNSVNSIILSDIPNGINGTIPTIYVNPYVLLTTLKTWYLLNQQMVTFYYVGEYKALVMESMDKNYLTLTMPTRSE